MNTAPSTKCENCQYKNAVIIWNPKYNGYRGNALVVKITGQNHRIIAELMTR